MNTIEVRGLRKTYPGGVEAVKGIDFDVRAGEVFGLLGPNGAGKSTTIGILTTTVAPTGGSARLAGYDVAEQPLKARSVSSVVFQEAVVDGTLSGRENLELHARLWGVDPTSASGRIEELAERVAIIHDGEIVALDRPATLLAGLGEEILEFRVDGHVESAFETLRARGVAGPDAYAVGASVTIPLHERSATDALQEIREEG